MKKYAGLVLRSGADGLEVHHLEEEFLARDDLDAANRLSILGNHDLLTSAVRPLKEGVYPRAGIEKQRSIVLELFAENGLLDIDPEKLTLWLLEGMTTEYVVTRLLTVAPKEG